MRTLAVRRRMAGFAVALTFGAPVGVALATTAATSPAAAAPAAAAAPSSAVNKPASLSSISHLVLMTQGGRSFDNYFGARPGVNGIPATVCQLRSKVSQPKCVKPRVITSMAQQRPLRTTAGAQVQSVNRGPMNGFVKAQTSRESDGSAALGYFKPSTLPLINQLADRGVVFDDWFSGVPGGTIGNRLFDLTAKPAGDPSAVPPTGWPATPVIFDRLTAAGITWKVYVQNYEPALTIDTASTKQRLGGQIARVPLLAMPRYLTNPALSSNIEDLSHYYADSAANKLPSVSYIVSTSSTEQSPQDPRNGNLLTRTVVNSLLASKAWAHSAFLLQYDSSGGWYDHVRPPRIDGATVGLRVPALMISPYVTPGTVDHDKLDAASALKLIERRWSVAPLAARDRDAGDMSKAFSFSRHPSPASLVGITGDRSVVQPDRAILYLGYAAVVAVSLMIGGYVLYAGLRDARPSNLTGTAT